MNYKQRVLIIGKIPPPIGGVSVHVKRLVSEIKKNDEINVDILDYSKERSLIVILKKIIRAKVVHIHLSNKFFRLITVVFFLLFLKKVVITFHGKYNFNNYWDILTLKYCKKALLLNKYSFENANKFKKKNIHLIGSFIPPMKDDIKPLNKSLIDGIEEFKTNYKFVFSTNASNFVLDSYGNEIYMGSELVNFFSENKNYGLIFSDPTGNYYKFFHEFFDELPKNIYFISQEHDFVNVIKQTDALIRATTTDGDSISVKEALHYGKQVFATNIVERPEGVTCFNDFVDLKNLIDNFNLYSKKVSVKNNFEEILALYKTFKKR